MNYETYIVKGNNSEITRVTILDFVLMASLKTLYFYVKPKFKILEPVKTISHSWFIFKRYKMFVLKERKVNELKVNANKM